MESLVVTGMGIVSGLGVGCEATAEALLAGRSAVGELRYLHTEHRLPCAEVPLSDEQLRQRLGIDPGQVITRTTLLGIEAAGQALRSSGLPMDSGYCIAFISGTTVGGMEKSEQYYIDFLEGNAHSEYIRVHDCGACTEQIAGHLGRFDFISTTSTACSSATNAMIMGANMIRAGIVDAAIVGGSECLTKFHLNGFNTLMILDSEPCRPFDATRAGLNLGEGAAYLVIEREQAARSRGAELLCRVSGFGNACDAYHQTASSPDGKGALMAMREALQSASLDPSQIDYINAHGTATPNNDESEAQAILSLFGQQYPAISSTKAHTGHTTSAAGAVEGVISILAIRDGYIPPTLNHRQDMEPGVKVVTRLRTGQQLRHVMSNSFGFGGNNSSIIFSSIDQ